MTKLTAGFHNYADVPKMHIYIYKHRHTQYYYCCDRHAHNS